MKLLIHDLDRGEWEKLAEKYSGWKVIEDNGEIKPCVGCFGCWTRTPGECVIKDGYGEMGELIHQADEVVVISRYTYGGLSPFVKNVIDRSIAYVLPFFEIVDGEMHHKTRYSEKKEFTFVFRGSNLSEAQKEKARKYVEAVCRNLHGHIKDITFEECEAEPGSHVDSENSVADAMQTQEPMSELLLLNCSMRGENANSYKILERLAADLKDAPEILNMGSYTGKYEELEKKVAGAKKVVLGMPLYVDGVPSAPLKLMKLMENCQSTKQEAVAEGLQPKKIYLISNMGFYESRQQQNLMSMVREWCGCCGFEYGGGVAVGAGEMIGNMLKAPDLSKTPAGNVGFGLKKLAEAINTSAVIEDIYADAAKFPRFLYMFAANFGWPRSARMNGLKKKDLYRQLG